MKSCSHFAFSDDFEKKKKIHPKKVTTITFKSSIMYKILTYKKVHKVEFFFGIDLIHAMLTGDESKKT